MCSEVKEANKKKVIKKLKWQSGINLGFSQRKWSGRQLTNDSDVGADSRPEKVGKFLNKQKTNTCEVCRLHNIRWKILCVYITWEWDLCQASEAKKLQKVNKVSFFKGLVSQCVILIIPRKHRGCKVNRILDTMTDRIRFLSSKGFFDQSNEDG